MKIADLGDVKLHWREDGDPEGRPLVFANSLGSDLRLWDKVVALLPSGLRVIRFDKRGHGLSSCPEGPYSIEKLGNDAAALLDHLGVKNAAFVGLSIGGMIAQRLAHQRPDLIGAMVLSNTAVKMGDAQMWSTRIAAIEEGGINALTEAILERWFGKAFRRTDELEAWRNMLSRTPQAGYIACCHALAAADLTSETAKLTLPTCAIAGEEDGSSPPELVAATAALIQGARCITIPGTGHLPCVEAPEAYANILTEFLKETGYV